MNISDELNARIEDYVNGLISEEDRTLFEAEMSKDDSLQKAVVLERKIQSAFEKKGKSELEARIAHIAAQVKKETKVIPFYRKWMRVMAVAASIALIVAVYFALRSNDIEATKGDLLAYVDTQLSSESRYINDYIDRSTLRGDTEGDEQEKELNEVYAIISSGDYLAAKRKVTSYLNKYPNDPNGVYAKAQIFMSEGRWGNAIEQLNILRTVDSRALRNEAEYYYALCHFKILNGKEEGIKIMKSIAENERSEYRDLAKDMLEYFD